MLASPPLVHRSAVLLDNLVYLGLFVLLAVEVYKGPFNQISQDDTKFVSERVSKKSITLKHVPTCIWLNIA